MNFKYVLLSDGVFLTKFDPRVGAITFLSVDDRETAVKVCQQLSGTLGKVTALEIPEEEYNKMIGKQDPYANIHLPGEGKTLFNITERNNPELR